MRALLACTLALAATIPAQAAAPAPDALSRMFTWWNQAFHRPDGFTTAAFAHYLTPAATLTIDGKTVIRGLDQWVAHFRAIQAAGGEVEIVVPFKRAFQAGDRLFTYHVIRSRRNGTVACLLAAGDARLEHGKIAELMLVRTTLDAAGRAAEPDCWQR